MKRHIKDFRIYPFTGYYRCGKVYQESDNFFTPLAQDSPKDFKNHNVCWNCVKSYKGKYYTVWMKSYNK